jgi:hypothetical protein
MWEIKVCNRSGKLCGFQIGGKRGTYV